MREEHNCRDYLEGNRQTDYDDLHAYEHLKCGVCGKQFCWKYRLIDVYEEDSLGNKVKSLPGYLD